MTNQTVSSDYLQRLQLDFDPFVRDKRGQVMYDGAERQARLEEAVHFLHFGTGIVLLQGASGAGKTSLLHRVLGQCGSFAERCWVEADEWSAEALPLAIGEQLGYAPAQCASWQGLAATLRAAPPEDIAVLGVDDADRLDEDVLAALWRLQQESEGRLRLLLTARSELWARLRQLPGAEDQVRVLVLRPLTVQELGELVALLLRAAGYQGGQPLSLLQLEELAAQSQGSVGSALDLVPQLLAQPEPSRFSRLPWPHIAAMVLVLVLLAASYWFQGSAGTQPAGPAAVAWPEPGVEPKAHVAQTVESEPTPVASTATKAVEPEQRPVVKPVQAKPAPATAEQAAPADKVENLAKAESVTKSPVQTEVAKPAVQAPTAQAPAKPVVTAPAPKPAAPKPAAALAADEQRLLALTPGSYLVQLLGSREPERIQRFRTEHGELKILVFETRLDGKPWHVALTGPYPDRDSARAAIEGLPAPLQKQGAWARSAASVQADIRRLRQL